MAVVRDEHPYLQEHYYVVSFVNGLKPNIRCNLRPQKPKTLTQAYWMAKDYESGLQAKYQAYVAPQDRQLQTHNSLKMQLLQPSQYLFPPAAPVVKKPGVCWRCNGPWVPGHRCKQAPNLHAITGEGNSEDITPKEEAQLVVLSNEGHLTESTELCMHISTTDVSGTTSSSTLSVLVTIGGKQGIALINTGTTNTFIDLKFAPKTSCELVNTSLKRITVAGGGYLSFGAYVPTTDFKMGTETFSHSFTLLDLKGYDIVIGCDMLSQHSPISLDFDNISVTLHEDKQYPVTFQDAKFSTPLKLITPEKLDKLSAKGAIGFVLSLHHMREALETLSPERETPPALLPVLEQYKDLFTEPKTLARERECDHAIPLKEGAVPFPPGSHCVRTLKLCSA